MPETENINEKVGRVVRRLRMERGLSQQRFAKEILGDDSPTAFKSVSKIETGYQALAPEYRKKIEEYFKLRDFDSLLQEPEDVGAPRALRLLSNREYFREHALFVDRIAKACSSKPSNRNGGPAEIWFFHPTDALPVLRKAEVKSRWVENLRLGIDKHLVWPLTFASDQTIRTYRNLAVELADRVSRLPVSSNRQRIGEIVFWALYFGHESPAQKIYKRMHDEFEKSSLAHLKICKAFDVSKREFQALKELLLFRSTVLNKSNLPIISSYCATYLDDVGSSPSLSEDLASGWLFHGQRMLAKLEDLTERLKEIPEGNEKRKHHE